MCECIAFSRDCHQLSAFLRCPHLSGGRKAGSMVVYTTGSNMVIYYIDTACLL